MKKTILTIVLAIVVVAAIVGAGFGIKSHNTKVHAQVTAKAEARVASMVDRYSKLSEEDEVVVDPLFYHYNEEMGTETRILESSYCGDWYTLSVIAVNLHYEQLEDMGKDAFVSYCRSLSSAEQSVILLVSCEPQTREYCYYQLEGLTILSLYSNTEYEGTLTVDNYSHPGYITFSAK